MSDISVRRCGETVVLTLSGDYSLYQVSGLGNRFRDALREPADRYEIDLRKLIRMDLSVLQLLLAFQKEIKAGGGTLVIRCLPAPDPFTSAALEYGFQPGHHFVLEVDPHGL